MATGRSGKESDMSVVKLVDNLNLNVGSSV